MFSGLSFKTFATRQPSLLPFATQFPALFMSTVVDNRLPPPGVPQDLWEDAFSRGKQILSQNNPSDPDGTCDYISARVVGIVRQLSLISAFNSCLIFS